MALLRAPLWPLSVWLRVTLFVGAWTLLFALLGISEELWRAALTLAKVTEVDLLALALALLVGLCFGLWARPFRWAWAVLIVLHGLMISTGLLWDLLPGWLIGVWGFVAVSGAVAVISAVLIVQMARTPGRVAVRYDRVLALVIVVIGAVLLWQALGRVQTLIALDAV